MASYTYLFDILKYTIAGVGVIYIAFYLFKPYMDKAHNLQALELRKAISNQTLPLRLQAYERLVLLIDRIDPANLLIRLNANAYSAAELYNIILNEVRTEYQHNVTQQIYVSSQAWAAVKRIKDDTVNLVTNAMQGLPPNATGLDMGKTILNHLATLENNPYELATAIVKKDMDQIF
ncbi:hypothetical protein CKK33_00225 [Mucilaginibacter sp. MD40]|uniref:DUF7935 family protein n=1 Tax=Mucilaginibacter sp. MD40 TaxID=2029590 RepID=UPI000BAC83EE|nr:hypothetical protein [Mucilaginibacter sp. MD40]PAW92003.1 hypothetical protein CKK33_00225 [Mucilaginibacter sp. MD40]